MAGISNKVECNISYNIGRLGWSPSLKDRNRKMFSGKVIFEQSWVITRIPKGFLCWGKHADWKILSRHVGWSQLIFRSSSCLGCLLPDCRDKSFAFAPSFLYSRRGLWLFFIPYFYLSFSAQFSASFFCEASFGVHIPLPKSILEVIPYGIALICLVCVLRS